MLGLAKNLKVFACTEPCDMRRQAQGLLALVTSISKREPKVAELYVFWNRSRDMLKVVYLDDTGSCVFSKRLHRGRFALAIHADAEQPLATIGAEELASIVSAATCTVQQQRLAAVKKTTH